MTSLLIPHGTRFEQGHWFRTNISIYLSCPKCSMTACLDDHVIDKDGTVKPSVECPSLKCNFHENIILGGWNG